ncbi:MAG: metal-dependent transcriptional regulator [Clostridia bacterium]|nr:metal-dependent transcriptional regulator [Clostridia bacterium]
MISKALSEYLKTMYVLKKQNNEIRVTDIANKMNCTKPSVNKALKNLKEENLIKYEAYQEIVLTKEGEDLAKKILEAYDIAYVFFKDVLNLDENEAEEEAGKIKSTLNDDTLNRLAKYVQKQLDYNSLDCNYDINNERCRSCVRRMPKKS